MTNKILDGSFCKKKGNRGVERQSRGGNAPPQNVSVLCVWILTQPVFEHSLHFLHSENN